MLAAALSLAAGVLHFSVVPEYLRQWWGYGFFFINAALVQLVYGLLLMVRPWEYDDTTGARNSHTRYNRPIYLLGAAGNFGLITLYVITRVLGIPLIGPAAGRVEPVTPLGGAVALTEAVLVGALLILARRSRLAAAGSDADRRLA
jgi:hypothetical protein